MSVLEGYLTNDRCDFRMTWFCFLEEKEDKVEEENDSSVHESICPACETKYSTDNIKRLWNKGKQEQSATNPEKYEKMECIESLSFRDIKRNHENNNSRDDEENLEQIHTSDFREKKRESKKKTRQESVWLGDRESFTL